jgi:HAD superfamily phosphatase (TIGR01668 family)
MAFPLIPDIRVNAVFDISPDMLIPRGISLLLLDLDNTLAPYSGRPPSNELITWKDELEASGIGLFIVSNTKTERAAHFADQFGVSYLNRSRKPSTKALYKAMELRGKKPDETALAGDQIFTDILGANLCGITSIAVRPILLKNPLIALRYFLEQPFRLARRREDKQHE